MIIDQHWKVSNSCTLFIEGRVPVGFTEEAGAAENPRTFPLFANFFGAGPINEIMNLFIGGRGQNIFNALDLALWNNQIVRTLPLSISGLGLIPNALPVSGILNLFLLRDKYSEAIPLFIRGRDYPITNIMNLFMHGHDIVNRSLNLSIPHVYGKVSKDVNLYINGY